MGVHAFRERERETQTSDSTDAKKHKTAGSLGPRDRREKRARQAGLGRGTREAETREEAENIVLRREPPYRLKCTV